MNGRPPIAYLTKRKLGSQKHESVVFGFTKQIHKVLAAAGVTHAQVFYCRSTDEIVFRFMPISEVEEGMKPSPFPVKYGVRKGKTPLFCIIAMNQEQAERVIPLKGRYFTQYMVERAGETGPLGMKIKLNLPIMSFESADAMRSYIFGENARRMLQMKGMPIESIKRELQKSTEQIETEATEAELAEQHETMIANRESYTTRMEGADLVYRAHGGPSEITVIVFCDNESDVIYLWPGESQSFIRRQIRNESFRLDKEHPLKNVESIKMAVKLAFRIDNPVVTPG